jgi:hypothetical protein
MAAAPQLASLRSLCGINLSILSQKLGLMDALVSKYGHNQALEQYKSTCPLVGATIGQHVRHSMDHMELAVVLAATYNSSSSLPQGGQHHPSPAVAQLHYDLRVRGGTLEHDMVEAQKRIVDLRGVLRDLSQSTILSNDVQDATTTSTQRLAVQANFMLDGAGMEYGLPSTIQRELGFCAHHAIHHMAMIRIIALHHVGLDDLPVDFGRAPSTVHYDEIMQTDTQEDTTQGM